MSVISEESSSEDELGVVQEVENEEGKEIEEQNPLKEEQISFEVNEESKQQSEEVIVPLKKCIICSKQNDLSRCSNCKSVWYCSVDCQRVHWPEHKVACKEIAQNIDQKQKGKSIDDYTGLQWVGNGNFSEIFKGTQKETGIVYAIKKISKQRLKQVNKEKDVFMEKHCLSRLLENDYVAKIHSTLQDDENLYIVQEFIEGGELWKQIHVFGVIGLSLLKYYFGHIVKAIESIHNLGIIHRDIKSENILLTLENKIKLIDFGTARDLQNPDIQGSGNGLKGKRNYQHFVGTPQFMPPECIRNKDSNQRSDVYSLGCLFYQMISGNTPFDGGSEYLIFQQFQKTLEKEVKFPQDWLFTDDQIDLIKKMLVKKWEDRIELNDIKNHQFWGNGWDWDHIPDYDTSFNQMSSMEKFLFETKTDLYSLDKIDERSNQLLRQKEIIEQRTAMIQQIEQIDDYTIKLNYLARQSNLLLKTNEENKQQWP